MKGVGENDPVILEPSKGITQKLIKDFNLDDGDEDSGEGAETWTCLTPGW